MRIPIDEPLRRIAQTIVGEKKTPKQWAAFESDDMFQDGDYQGGFDADEGEFCFSYYSSDGEAWFQLSFSQVREIAAGGSPTIAGRMAE